MLNIYLDGIEKQCKYYIKKNNIAPDINYIIKKIYHI